MVQLLSLIVIVAIEWLKSKMKKVNESVEKPLSGQNINGGRLTYANVEKNTIIRITLYFYYFSSSCKWTI